jgi:hypothetical protein
VTEIYLLSCSASGLFYFSALTTFVPPSHCLLRGAAFILLETPNLAFTIELKSVILACGRLVNGDRPSIVWKFSWTSDSIKTLFDFNLVPTFCV